MSIEVDLNWLLTESELIKKTRMLSHEVLHIVAIDKKGNLVPIRTLDEGRTSRITEPTMTDLTIIEKKYKELEAVALIYIHNHPNTCYETFTATDIRLFERQKNLLKNRGMNLVDLLVISEKTQYSLYQLLEVI